MTIDDATGETRAKAEPVGAVLAAGTEILRSGVAIQCIEAVFAAIRLTHQLAGVVRFGISFTATDAGPPPAADAPPPRRLRHLVLGVHAAGRWGALGISRCAGLMTKPLRFADLPALLRDFCGAWAEEGRMLTAVTLGAPVPRAPTGSRIAWGPDPPGARIELPGGVLTEVAERRVSNFAARIASVASGLSIP